MIKMVLFYDISTIVGYLLPKLFVNINIYMICEHILWITFLNKPGLFFAMNDK